VAQALLSAPILTCLAPPHMKKLSQITKIANATSIAPNALGSHRCARASVRATGGNINAQLINVHITAPWTTTTTGTSTCQFHDESARMNCEKILRKKTNTFTLVTLHKNPSMNPAAACPRSRRRAASTSGAGVFSLPAAPAPAFAFASNALNPIHASTPAPASWMIFNTSGGAAASPSDMTSTCTVSPAAIPHPVANARARDPLMLFFTMRKKSGPGLSSPTVKIPNNVASCENTSVIFETELTGLTEWILT